MKRKRYGTPSMDIWRNYSAPKSAPPAVEPATRHRHEDYVLVRYCSRQAHVYADGGIAFSQEVPGVGWVIDSDPPPFLVGLALSVRLEAYPKLPPLSRKEVLA